MPSSSTNTPTAKENPKKELRDLSKDFRNAVDVPPFLIGADPEIFLKKDGKIISAHDIVPGTKEEPFQIDEYGTKVLSDGIALEFNINPAKTQEEFNFLIDKALESIKERLPEGVTFAENISGVFLEPLFMNLLPPSVAELGCDPDYNGYSGNKNTVDESIFKQPFRCVAGHIHIGWLDPEEAYLHPFPKNYQDLQKDNAERASLRNINRAAICNLVKMLDATLGIPFWLKDTTKLKNDRMRLYGNLGAFRFKPYGVEYRVPSNAWLWDKALRDQIFSKVHRAFHLTHLLETAKSLRLSTDKYLSYLKESRNNFLSLRDSIEYPGPSEAKIADLMSGVETHMKSLSSKIKETLKASLKETKTTSGTAPSITPFYATDTTWTTLTPEKIREHVLNAEGDNF